MTQETKQKIQKIANHYGYEPQSRQCQEECAELIQAINKLWRSRKNGYHTDKKEKESLENVIEELADVQLTIWQMIYLLNANVEPIIERKIARQMERIERE